MWPGIIIRENTRKSHFLADLSGKLSEVCQEFDLASSIITLKTYYYPINKRPLQMERAEEQISSAWGWISATESVYPEPRIWGSSETTLNHSGKDLALTGGVDRGLAGKNGSCLLQTREPRRSLLQLWKESLVDPQRSPSSLQLKRGAVCSSKVNFAACSVGYLKRQPEICSGVT